MAKFKNTIFILTFFLVACVSTHAQDPQTFQDSLFFEPVTVNPVFIKNGNTLGLSQLMFEPLLSYDVRTESYEGVLATSWQVLDDQKTYVFDLRKNVVWHDGTPFTADDVVASFQIEHPEMSPQWQAVQSQIASVKKLDSHRVEIRYKEIYYRGLIECGSVMILPAHKIKEFQNNLQDLFRRDAIGTGIYKLKKWYEGTKIVLKKNKAYWGKGYDFENYVVKFLRDNTLAFQKLKKGELDYLVLREVQWMRQTQSQKFAERFHKIRYPANNYSFLAWNNKNELFADKRVRKAMTHLVKRAEILQKLNYGLGTLITGPFHPKSERYNSAIKPLEYSGDKALQLLFAAGWDDTNGDGWLDKNGKKFEFTLMITDTPFSKRLSTIIKEDFKKAGVDVKLKITNTTHLFQKLFTEKQFDATLLKFGFGYDADPYNIWHSQSYEKGYNFVGYFNPEVDALIEAAQKEFDRDKRNALYKKMHKLIHEDQPYTFLFVDDILMALSKKVKSPKVYPRGLVFEDFEADPDFKF